MVRCDPPGERPVPLGDRAHQIRLPVVSCSSSKATGSVRSAAGAHFGWPDSHARSRASKPLALRSSQPTPTPPAPGG